MTVDKAERFQAVLAEYLQQVDAGEQPDRRAFLDAHPDLADDLAGYFEVQDRMERLARTNHDTHPTFGGRGTPSHPELPADGTPLPAGSLLGQYRLDEVIGEGAMGRIYKATHLHLDRTLAIKVLAPNLARDAHLVQRFHREARALAKLQHPNIVGIHDMGSQGDMHYFVMEYVPGVNLRQLMGTGEVSPERALGLVGKVCDALHYAHDRGIVHRDIKPENILVDRAGQPRVADFGLAKVLQDEHPSANLTGTHVVLGTYNYMAPEQKSSAHVDHRADIYAVGVVLYELLTGKLPAGHFDPPSHAARVAPEVDRLVLKALHSEPERRYQSAHDLGTDIGSALGGGPAPGLPPREPAAPPGATRTLKVIDSRTDAVLGTGEAAWLRLDAKSDDEVEVRTWSRPEVGVTSDSKTRKKKAVQPVEMDTGPWIGEAAGTLPGLRLRLPDDDVTVHVPEDLPVRVCAAEADVTVSSLRAPLRIDAGEGTVKVRDHVGPLDVERTERGAVSLNGVSSSDLSVTTRDGRIVTNGLRLRSGRAKLHADDGDIHLGVDEAQCGFRYEARTLSGHIRDELHPSQSTTGVSTLRGTVGRGDAELVVDTFEGDIRIGHVGEREWVFEVREAGQNLFWAIVWISAAVALGHESIAWILFWCWGLWAALNVIKPVMRARPWDTDGPACARSPRADARHAAREAVGEARDAVDEVHRALRDADRRV